MYCYAIIANDVILEALTKPLPVMILITRLKLNSKYSYFILFGFIFSLAGDIFLLHVVDKFKSGLVAFLLAHIFYIIAFTTRSKEMKILSSIPFYVVAGLIIFYLYPHLSQMKIAVIVYVIVITTMAWRSYIQRNYNNTAVYAFTGAVLFVISDLNLASNKFVHPYEYAGIVTIITYWTAQYFIARSAMK